MPFRTDYPRQKKIVHDCYHTFYTDNDVVYETYNPQFEDTIEYTISQYPTGTDCVHETYFDGSDPTERLTMKISKDSPACADWYWLSKHPYFFVDPYQTHYLWEPNVNALNWKKLNTSSKFNILTFLFELDKSLEMFGNKFTESLSYGGYKWGWIPFLNDLAAIGDALKKLGDNASQLEPRQKYHDTHNFTVKRDFQIHSGFVRRHTWTVKVEMKGYVDVHTDLICRFYDFIGFHPSFSAAWDLVPLSFMLDRVIPIGDGLDRLRYAPHGWVQAALFTGVQTIKATCVETTVHKPFNYEYVADSTRYKYFRREKKKSNLIESKTSTKPLTAKLPDFGTTFDAAYIAKTFLKKK